MRAFKNSSSVEHFREDTLNGLRARNKTLSAKYFYDAKGDVIFQKIMRCPEYYLTNCELEILSRQTTDILSLCRKNGNDIDLVELGPGDAFKSIYLLENLAGSSGELLYIPIDISSHVVTSLEKEIPEKIKNVRVKGMPGEYLEMLSLLKENNSRAKKKLILFLGSSMGNMDRQSTLLFLQNLRKLLHPGDLFLLGVDLIKDPEIILEAYNDRAGFTKEFNLNLLLRINKELQGNFHTGRFSHFPVYDTDMHACKSYLVSLMQQEVIVSGETFSFAERETIYMEMSQKYDLSTLEELARQAGFMVLHHFLDSKRWFVDSLWKA